ncbi:MAG: SlyX family protein [Spirochaetales bacterium]|nr:SlyX family protein [Spirochaetales bacterium]
MDDRLINVEMQLTYAQEKLETLNGVVTEQGMELQRLKSLIEQLERRIVEQLDEGEDGSRKPPHY